MTKPELMKKLPKRYRDIRRLMIKWLDCDTFGMRFGLITLWKAYEPEDPDVWLTPAAWIKGKQTSCSFRPI